MRKRLIAMLVAGCSSAAMAGEPGWTVSEISGPVQVGHGGLSKIATRGLAVGAGDTVTTGPGGRAVLTRGTEYMMVAARSQLRLPQTVQAEGFTQMIEDFGNVVFMIKKKMTPHFEVKTPYLAAVVKGTTFSVGVTSAGASVQVLEGAVDVATMDGGAHDLLRPGAVAIVGAGDRYRMRIESGGVSRTIASPAAPAAPPAPLTPSSVAEPDRAVDDAAPAVSEPVITAAVYEAPVSLSTVTGGLITGTVGGPSVASDIAEVATATRTVTEASTSAVKAVDIATRAIAAEDANNQAVAAAQREHDTSMAASQAQAYADKTAADAAVAAQHAAESRCGGQG